MFAIAVDQPFRFPAAFTFVLRAFTTLEGLGKALDPDYKFADVARPYALELLDLQVRRAQGLSLQSLGIWVWGRGLFWCSISLHVLSSGSRSLQMHKFELVFLQGTHT